MHLRARGLPRLLLIENQTPPPQCLDNAEDWVRLPAREEDILARRDRLASLALSAAAVPTLDDWGVLRFHVPEDAANPGVRRRLTLPPIEARLTRALLREFEAVVAREVLLDAGWPGEEPARNALDVRILRLRKRLRPVGLHIRTVRSRGYLLERFVNSVSVELTGSPDQ